MARRPGRQNVEWETPKEDFRWEHVRLEVLMDIRDQLKQLNATLSCYRVRRMSDDVNRIDKRLQKAGFLVTGKRKP